MTDTAFARITAPRSDLLAAGWSDQRLTRGVRTGALERVRLGDYRFNGPEQTAEESHRDLVRATAARFKDGRNSVVSHLSAAALYGVALGWPKPARAHVTRPGRPGASASGAVHPHRAILADDEVTLVEGIPVTTPARTVLDVARFVSFEQAVVVADGLLHAGLVSGEEIAMIIERARLRRSAGRAPLVAAFADGRSESPAESASRVMFAALGFPAPALQAVVRAPNGREIGRVDFLFEEFSTVGECDGVSKYVRYLGPGEEIADIVIREKYREDEIRSLNLQVVRWTPQELVRPRVIEQRFLAAFGRAGFGNWLPGPPRVPFREISGTIDLRR